MKVFIRTDEQWILYLCSAEGHKGHDTEPAAAERTERQRSKVSRQTVLQRIDDREDDMKMLQEEMEAINRAADKAVEDREEKSFTELIRVMEKRCSDVKQQVSRKVGSKSFRRIWSRRSLNWRGEALSWRISHTQRITTTFHTTTPHCQHLVSLHTHPASISVLWSSLRMWQQLCQRSEINYRTFWERHGQTSHWQWLEWMFYCHSQRTWPELTS